MTLGAASLLVGQTTTATAEVLGANGAVLTGRTVTWSSSNPAVATVANGVVTAIAAGTAEMTASADGITGRATLTVAPIPAASIRVALAASTLIAGQSTTATAEVLGANGAVLTGRTVTWSSSNPTVATVANGVVTSIAAGTAEMTASADGITGRATLTVAPIPAASIRVALAASTLIAGQSTTAAAEVLSASGVVLSGRTVTWSSSNPAVATVANGTVTAIAAGTAEITAAAEGITGRAALTVTSVPQSVASVTLSIDSIDVPIRSTVTIVATPRDAAGQPVTGQSVTWVTSAADVATVSAVGGVRVLQPGTATITATVAGRTARARIRGVVFDLTRMLDSVRLARNLPALGAMIVSREGLVAIGVSGVRSAGSNTPVTLADRWHLGSNTKALTGFLGGMAVQAGVLAWTNTLADAFPDLANVMRPEYRPVTLRELMSHTSGLVNTTNGLPPSGIDLSGARLDWVRTTVQQPPQNARGVYYYSNNGFGTAGAMIERAWGQSYESLMASRLFQPLGVTTLVGWGPADQAGQLGVTGHSWTGSAWMPCVGCDNRAGLSSAGTMNATLAGWGRIIQEILLADQGRSVLVTQATARSLTAATYVGPDQQYGMGWGVGGSPTNRFVGHDGSNTTNTSRAWVYLDAGVAYLMVTNAADYVNGALVYNLVGTTFNTLGSRLDGYWINGR